MLYLRSNSEKFKMKEQLDLECKDRHRDNKTDTHRRKYKMRKVKVAAVQMRCTERCK